MRILVAALPLLLLAACADGSADNVAGNAGAPDNAAAAAADAKPADAAADPLAAARRADMIRECSDDVRPELPPGTDLDAFCGCAVDRMTGDTGEREAMEACAAEMGIQPQRR